MAETDLFRRLRDRVLGLDATGVRQAIEEALAAGVEASEIVSRGLAVGMERVGEKFEQGEFFLPELLLSARAMQGGLDVLRPHLIAGGHAAGGRVVLGTVRGDIHEIGKNIVGAVLAGDGFDVHDLGEDVAPEAFVAKAKEVDAEVVGLSALISIAVSRMAETIALLKEHGLGTKVIVGGAAVTPEVATSIGADAFAKDAWDGLRRIRAFTAAGAQP